MTPWRSRLWRWRWLLTLVALLVLVRANLPWIIRRVLVAQASALLRADVALGDVDLALYKGGVALHDLAIRLRPTPIARPTGGDGDAAHAIRDTQPTASTERTGEAAARPAAPILAWKTFAVSLRWWPLVRKTIQLREIVLDSPQIVLERFANGELNFEALARAAMEARAESGTPGATPFPAAVPSPSPAGEPAASSGWLMGVDRIALAGGQLRFLDHTLKGSDPIDIAVPSIEVHDISLSPDVYGEPSESKLRVTLDEGSLELGAHAALAGADVKLDSQLRARSLPLRRSRLYVPGAGWSELKGSLDADLEYTLETGKVNAVRGSVSLRDLAINVPELPREALTLKQLTVRVDPIDLHNHSANVAEINLDGVWVVSRPSDPILLPILAAAKGDSEGEPIAERKAAAKPEEEKKAAPPWSWSVKAVRIADSGMHLIGGDHVVDVHISGQASDLAPGLETTAPVDLTFRVGEGSVRIEGQARVDPPGFAGDLRVGNLSLAELVDISRALPENPVKSAKLSTDLLIEAGMAKAERPKLDRGDMRVSGKLALADTHVTSGGTDASAKSIELQIKDLSLAGALPSPSSPSEPASAPPARQGTLHFSGDLAVRGVSTTLADLNDCRVTIASLGVQQTEIGVVGLLRPPPEQAPAADAGDVRLKTRIVLGEPRIAVGEGKDFLVTLRSLELGLSDVGAPGVLAPQPRAAARPIRVAASDLKLEQPRIRVTLTSEGMVLPGPRAPSAPPGAAPSSKAAAQPTPDAPPTAAAGPAPSPAVPGIEIALDRLRVAGGRVTFNDRTLKPPLTTELDDIKVSGRALRFPELEAKELQLAVTTPEQGEIEVSGALAGEGGKLQLEAREVLLTPYNPYVASFSPYQLTTGGLSISTTVSGAARKYEVENAITLHDLDVERVSQGEGFVEGQLGMPVGSILALLRDPQGNIKLNVPLEIGEEGASVDIMAVMGNALKAAMIGAITSPLKLVGSLTGSGDKVGAFAPKPIPFRLGGSALTKEGAQVVEGLAALMESRPGVGVELEAQVAKEDARALREHALLQKWGEEGVFGGLLSLAQRGARARVRAAIEGRAQGEEGALSPEDARELEEWLNEIPEPTLDQIKELAAARLGAVVDALHAKHIDDARFVEKLPGGNAEEAQASVKIKLRPVSKLRAVEEQEGRAAGSAGRS